MVVLLLIGFVWAVIVGFVQAVFTGLWFVAKAIVHLAQGNRPD